MNETNEKAKELIGINLDIFPEFSGARVKRDIKIGDDTHKFTIQAPIVTTDEDAQAVYGVSLATICEKGCLQITYARDTSTANMIKEDLGNGVNFGELADVGKYANEIQTSLATAPTAREGKRAVEKAQSAEYRALGLDDPKELEAMKVFMARRREKESRKNQ